MLVTLLICQSVFADISGNTFRDPKSGFAISKPSDWVFVTHPKTHGIALKGNGLTAAENGLIITFTKDMGDGFFGVKPSVGIKQLTVAPKSSLLQWLEGEMKSQAFHDKQFVSASSPVETKIEGGRAGARAAFTNSTIIEGREVVVYHAVYVVASGDKVFLINMDCNDDLANKFVDIFAEIAGTIHLATHW